MNYPEHEKLAKVADKSQTVGEFLDWLQNEKHVTLCTLGCSDQYFPTNSRIKDLLGEFFKIDQDKLEEEKQHMLKQINFFKKTSLP